MPNEHAGSRGVKSDDTLFAIIEQLREADGAGVTELADRTGLAKSTVHDHLASMRAHDFVVKRGDAYHLGLQFFSYGQYVRNRYDVYEAAKPIVDDLVETTGEMGWLLTHENGRLMYLYGRAGRTNINANTLIGSWAYMHCNSGGKAILAHLPESDVRDVIDRHGLPARTANTITEPDALFEELAQVREQGYALNLGEDLEGIHAVAVPLLFGEEVHGALAVAGPAHRVNRERCEGELAERLRASTNDVELNLAYR
ncbi:IclR family transcriptional regulator (plasmid) [Halorarum halophilum]|uniref:IclR family transcriptional regulator n=1 Tax=Halorarum halophilum TaxID=2743090 RepID=A0A7D5H3B4_9EURY|nr:IclR family transcriptional regulator [Halobaculum halophilum]QLG29633.1 IclR family transcriptional regulator [Halobaculum halophilum]